MPALSEIKTSNSGGSHYRNFIVIPGFAGGKLGDATCPHFEDWLSNILGLCTTSARSWVFKHNIQLKDLESWDKYSTTGYDLLEQLLLIQRRLDEEETIILIGHKLGCYILKQALIEAWNNEHKDDYKQLLDMIETIMLIGEPCLNPKKPDEWIDNISECVSRHKNLPRRLGNGDTVGCLQYIADTFERILLHSTILDVTGARISQPKRMFRVKRLEHDGCIGCPTIHIRLFTMSDEERILDAGPGDVNICPFHPESAHFKELLRLKSAPQLPQLEAPANEHDGASVGLAAIADGSVDSSPTVATPTNIRPMQAGDLTESRDDIHPFSPSGWQNPPKAPTTLHRIDTETATIEIPSSQIERSDDEDADEKVSQLEAEERSHQGSTENQCTSTSIPSLVRNPPTSRVSARGRRSCFSSSIPSRDGRFFGRSDVLSHLNEIILSQPSQDEDEARCTFVPSRQASNLVLLAAGPGMGKTSIAAEFAHRSKDKFEYVIWLDASSKANIGKHCHDAAVALGLVNERTSQNHQDSTAKLMETLKCAKCPWLLVLDDFAPGIDLATTLIPAESSLCSIIVTRRRRSPPWSSAGWTVIDVPPLREEEAREFFIDVTDGQVTKKALDNVCSALSRCQFSPLVIRQLATWGTRDTISFQDMTKFLEGHDVDQLTFRTADAYNVLSRTLLDRLNQPATSLLLTLSFYNSSHISKRLLRTIRIPQIDGSSHDCQAEDTLSDATSRLWRSALLDTSGDYNTDSPYCMHKSVQEWIRTQVDDQTWRFGFDAACSSLRYQWPSKKKLKNIMGGFWEEYDNLNSHVHHLADCLTRDRLFTQLSYDPGDEFKQLLVHHTWYNSHRGNHAEDGNLRNLTEFLLTTTASLSRSGEKNDGAMDSQPSLPKRCIMVSDDDGNPTARLVNTHGSCASYICLSYSWDGVWGGDTRNHRLTTENLARYQEGIDMSVLPQQIVDAVSFTQNMKVRYLWVDALCIVQDSPLEVAGELERLVQYYTHSFMIISSLKNGGASSHSSPPSSSSSFSQHLKWEPSQRMDIPPYSILRSRTTLHGSMAERTWRRAGRLQERCFKTRLTQKNISGSTSAVGHFGNYSAQPSEDETLDVLDPVQTNESAETADIEMPQRTTSARDTSTQPRNEPGQLPQDSKEPAGNSNQDPAVRAQADHSAMGQNEVKDQQKPMPCTETSWVEELLIRCITIAILRTGVSIRWALSTMQAGSATLMRRVKEYPWVVCCVLCIWMSAFSYSLGARAVNTGTCNS